MSDKVTSWKYVEQWPTESTATRSARERSEELGVNAVSPATASSLTLLATAIAAHTIVEVGTGAGVSGLALLAGNETSILTTIDPELEHQEAAKKAFKQAGIATNRTRMIGRKASEVMNKLADDSYDLVFIDGDPGSVPHYLIEGLRIARPGGVIAINHALWEDRVSDPVQRDEVTTVYRKLLEGISEDASLIASLSPVGDGLLTLVKPR